MCRGFTGSEQPYPASTGDGSGQEELDREPIFNRGFPNDIKGLNGRRVDWLKGVLRQKFGRVVRMRVLVRRVEEVDTVICQLVREDGSTDQLQILALGHTDLSCPTLVFVPDLLDALYLASHIALTWSEPEEPRQ